MTTWNHKKKHTQDVYLQNPPQIATKTNMGCNKNDENEENNIGGGKDKGIIMLLM